MGCDIHTFSFKFNGENAEYIEGDWLDFRSYGVFGFLANVRNYSRVPVISGAPRGLPPWCPPELRDTYEEEFSWYHTATWLTMKELTEFDYDQQFEDLRITIRGDGGCTGEPGEGEIVTFREFLGPGFFDDLERARAAGVEAFIMYFGN